MPFSDVIGHKSQAAWLRRQVATGRVSHAYLFLGPTGVGKRFLAQQLAQALQCEQPVDGDACGRCPMCHQIARGLHPDLLSVAPMGDARQVKIDQIRQLQQWASLAAFHGRRKVAILDGVETMQEAASSALLKTVEEPPPTVTLLLIATHESRLLPTLVSRCAKVVCGPLAPRDLRAALVERGVDPSRADAVVRRSAGRLGRARQLAAPEVWDRQHALLDEWPACVENGGLEPSLAGRPRQEVEEALEEIAAWYHDLLLVSLGIGSLAYPDRLTEARRQVAGWTPEALLQAIEAVYETKALVGSHVNPRLALAALVARLAKPVTSDK